MALSIGTPRPCKGCGKTIFKLKFCSNVCREEWYAPSRSRAEILADARKSNTKVCTVCYQTFVRRIRPGYDEGLCCSRRCGFTLIRWRGEQSRRVHQAKAEFAKWAKLAKARPRKAAQPRTCADCGMIIGKFKHRCAPCAEARAAQSRRRAVLRPSAKIFRRADKSRRKAMARGMSEGAERFDPLEVLARDGWRCHICGISTPKRLRGTYDDQAPELDHIVPLARGGKHTRLNTACACRRCNINKGSRVIGQLRLVA